MSQFLDTLLASAVADPQTGSLTTRSADGTFRTQPWSAVHADACSVAGALRERGIGVGDAVAVFMGDPAEVAVAVQAVWLVGASVTMLHQPTARTNLTTYAAETIGILKMIEADALILGAPYVEFAGHFATAARRTNTAILTIGELRGSGAAFTPDAEVVDDRAIALLQLTSGSTAAPKAVRISHGSLISNMRAMCAASAITYDDIMLSWLPVFHDMGMVGFLTVPMTFGFQLVKLTPADFVASPTSWMRLISERGATITAAPNFAYGMAARALRKTTGLDLSALRIALNGAEPIDPGTVRAFIAAGEPHQLNPGCVLCAYGMAEAALAVSFAPVGEGLVVDRVDQRILSSAGRAEPVGTGEFASEFAELGAPVDGIDLKIVDAEGKPLGDREVGTIMLRGTAITDGYITADGFIAAQDDDGWLDTGDEGYLADGQIVVCGRIKDLIIVAGRNIYPTDIERAAERVEGVRPGNTAAVMVTHAGRESFAVVVESSYADDEQQRQRIAQDVMLAVNNELDARPARVVVQPPGTLLKTPSGKIQRSRVRAQIENRDAAP